MFGFTGVRFCFSVAAGVAERVRLRFRCGEEAFDVGDATWRVSLMATGAVVEGMEVSHGGGVGELLLYVPPLNEGRYEYEVAASSAAGDVDRVVYGVLTVLSSQQVAGMERQADVDAVRQMDVLVPTVAGAPLRLAWQGTSLAAAMVGEVQQAAGAAQGEMEGLLEEARLAASDAAASALQAQQALQEAGESVAQLSVVQAFIASFENKVVSVVRVDPQSGHLVIGYMDTQVKLSGDPGKSPYVAEDGRWRYYDDVSQQWLVGPSARGEEGKAPYISSMGTWVEWDAALGHWRDTGLLARGKDGIDGATVRRMVVPTVADIPQEGETCNGGHLYYVPLADAWPVALLTVQASGRTVADRLVVNGQEVLLPSPDLEAEAAALELSLALHEVFPDAEVSVSGATVTMRGDVLAWRFEGLNAEGYGLVQHVRMPRRGYDVYAWLETLDGEAGWRRAEEAEDIATTEVFGLSRRGTDRVVVDGAPVGHNEHGRMSVPRAEYTVPGAVLPGVDFVLESGGGVGFDAEGRMFCRMATVEALGAVKPSFSGSNLAAVVGIMADGSLGIPWGSWTQAGVFRAGSQFGQSNPIPFIQGVGVTQSHELANNLLYSGAIRHMNPPGWAAAGMAWLEVEMEGHPEFFTDIFYTGLVHSPQFSQSMEQGLELLSASVDLVAGVFLAGSMQDERENATPCAKMVRDWVEGYAYSKSDVYTKGAVDDKVAFLQGRISALREDAANAYLTVNKAAMVYETKDAATTIHRLLQEGIDGCVRRRASWIGNEYLTQAEYDALDASEIDPLVEYNILEDEV